MIIEIVFVTLALGYGVFVFIAERACPWKVSPHNVDRFRVGFAQRVGVTVAFSFIFVPIGEKLGIVTWLSMLIFCLLATFPLLLLLFLHDVWRTNRRRAIYSPAKLTSINDMVEPPYETSGLRFSDQIFEFGEYSEVRQPRMINIDADRKD